MAESTKSDKGVTVPYIAFRTVLNLADRLQPDPPPRVDRSVLSYLSGGYRSQLLIALKSLNLVDDAGVPQAELVALVTEPDKRKEIVDAVWRRVYASVFNAIDVSRATADQLTEAFAVYNVSGDTRSKAITFFVNGCEFADIPISTHIKTQSKRTRPSKPRKRGETAGGSTPDGGNRVPPPGKPPIQEFVSATNWEAVHPMLAGAIRWLYENGATWTSGQAEIWCKNFEGNVKLVYPPKPDPDTARRDASDSVSPIRSVEAAVGN